VVCSAIDEDPSHGSARQITDIRSYRYLAASGLYLDFAGICETMRQVSGVFLHRAYLSGRPVNIRRCSCRRPRGPSSCSTCALTTLQGVTPRGRSGGRLLTSSL
jgi:hypothetical protein